MALSCLLFYGITTNGIRFWWSFVSFKLWDHKEERSMRQGCALIKIFFLSKIELWGRDWSVRQLLELSHVGGAYIRYTSCLLQQQFTITVPNRMSVGSHVYTSAHMHVKTVLVTVSASLLAVMSWQFSLLHFLDCFHDAVVCWWCVSCSAIVEKYRDVWSIVDSCMFRDCSRNVSTRSRWLSAWMTSRGGTVTA